ncbi:DUF4238 domain-containing protein [Pseudomonas sp. NPDC088444]|uniref:DUF4238 domain-containing protein n=1 Tax=Pseudomonas sp. NPDC088444 TaxID=3364456 RepID=UPI00384F7B7B
MTTAKSEPQKKRHHFVPKAYLKAFCDENGRLHVYRKDAPQRALRLQPDSTQFQTYYYSQPMPDGGQDNNTLENVFAAIETDWPATVNALHRRENINQRLQNLFEFMSLQRVRVPAARDMAEAVNAQIVKSTLNMLYDAGKLPPLPGGRALLEAVEVSIDPHRSIHAMPFMVQGMAELFNVIGLGALHNLTPIPFLTSDNPVIWFDPSKKFAEQLPYTVDLQHGDIQFLFPISPKLMIVGTRDLGESYSRNGLAHGEISDAEFVDAVNAQICRFAYESVISSTPGQENLVSAFADESPVLETQDLPIAGGGFSHFRHIFGKRKPKPRWQTKQG